MSMRDTDIPAFVEHVTKVLSFYRADTSEFAIDVWVAAMRPFDLAAVKDAFMRHALNPDTGQFRPMPADIIKMLGGTTIDQATTAWTKVDFAIRTSGPWYSVVFDDSLIHRVIADMGGWEKICTCSAGDYPFIAKDFQTRYRGFAMQGNAVSYPSVLIGTAQASNALSGFLSQPPEAIGDEQACLQVFRGGDDKPRIERAQLKLVKREPIPLPTQKRIAK